MMSQPAPRVTVIITTYRQAAFLQQAVESVARQTFTDYELIVVDDGSPDEVVRQYALPEGARLIRLPANTGGPSVPRNVGMQAARGRYVAFLDGDDVWLPGKLAAQVAVLEAHPEIAVTFCHFTRVDETLAPLRRQLPPVRLGREDLPARLIAGCFIRSPSLVLVRRAALEAAGEFDPRMPSAADWGMWLRMAPRARFHSDPTPHALYRVYAGQMSSVGREFISFHNDRYFLKKTLAWATGQRPDLAPLIRRCLARKYVRAARLQHAAGKSASTVTRTLRIALAYDPRYARAWGLLAWVRVAGRRE
ncbi:MAG: glycosyltransferase family 2 protein [Armatimonadota bacterium]